MATTGGTTGGMETCAWNGLERIGDPIRAAMVDLPGGGYLEVSPVEGGVEVRVVDLERRLETLVVPVCANTVRVIAREVHTDAG